MDYAKLALLKAEQLERQGQQASTITRRAGLVFESLLQPNTNFEICTLFGKGEAAMIVSLLLEDAGSGSVSIEFRLGSKTVFSRPYSSSMVFMASAELSGRLSVRLRASNQVKLLSADVLVIGGDIINSVAESVRVTELGGYSAAVYVSGGSVLLSAGQGIPDLSKTAIVGFGECASVAGITVDDTVHFAVCFVDNDKNVYLTLATADGQMLSCKRLHIKADALALIGLGLQLCIGYVYKGIAYAAFSAPPDFTPAMTTRLEEATSIEFVRQITPPAVILGKSKGSVIRLAQNEAVSEDRIALVFDC